MRQFYFVTLFILLSGCSKIADSWTCSIMSGHQHAVFEKRLEHNSESVLPLIKDIAKKEQLIFGAKDVEIVTQNRRTVRKLIEACNRNTQILADNFEDQGAFRIYVRGPSNPMNSQTKRVIGILSKM